VKWLLHGEEFPDIVESTGHETNAVEGDHGPRVVVVFLVDQFGLRILKVLPHGSDLPCIGVFEDLFGVGIAERFGVDS
jgi:hypothetical protein